MYVLKYTLRIELKRYCHTNTVKHDFSAMFIWSFFTAKLGLTVHNFYHSVPQRGKQKSEKVQINPCQFSPLFGFNSRFINVKVIFCKLSWHEIYRLILRVKILDLKLKSGIQHEQICMYFLDLFTCKRGVVNYASDLL